MEESTDSYIDAGEFLDNIIKWCFNLGAIAFGLTMIGYILKLFA